MAFYKKDLSHDWLIGTIIQHNGMVTNENRRFTHVHTLRIPIPMAIGRDTGSVAVLCVSHSIALRSSDPF